MTHEHTPESGPDPLALSPEAEALLLDVLEQPPDARGDYLYQSTDDPQLRQLVEQLLAVHANADRRLGRLARRLGGDSQASAAPPLSLPERAGPYRLERELGRGGMSVVCLGHRDDGQFEQTVAVKLLPGGPMLASLSRRFDGERRILARLEHPNLARLIDGGVTDEGWPYLAMEYVDGVPIDEYCDRERLDVAARLALFEQVLEAVQYAHRNLVVHRDIKPSNILVTGEGRVKLLDFGIAKVLEDAAESADATELTRLGGRPMSPAWASPEQLGGQPVTTASDIYSLGLLLYRLLTGHPPHAAGTADLQARRESMLEREPTRPSLKVLEAAGDNECSPEELAQRRASGPRRLSRALAGDLDNIVLTALRREPERRYATAEQFAADIQRHRAGLPVRARPDTWAYRSGKFIARHRLAVAGAVLVPMMIIGGLVVHTERLQVERDKAELAAAQAEQARVEAEAAARMASLEAQRSDRVSDYLVSLFRAAAPAQARGDVVTAQDLVALGAGQLTDLETEPLLRAALLTTLGEVNGALGQYREANSLFAEALEIYRGDPDADAALTAEAWNQFGVSLFLLGQLAEAEQAYHEALSVAPEAAGQLRARTLNHLDVVHADSNRFAQSSDALEDALALLEALAPGSEDHAMTLNILGTVRSRQGRHDEAIAMMQQALEMRRALFGHDHPDTTITLSNLGVVFSEAGRPAEARLHISEALEIDRVILGPDHPSLATLLNQLAAQELRLGEPEAAMEHLRQALDLQIAHIGEIHPLTGFILVDMAVAHKDLGDYPEAERFFRRAIEVERAVHGDEAWVLARTLQGLGELKTVMGEWDEAESLLMESLNMRRSMLGDDSEEAAASHLALAQLDVQRGRREQALAHALAAQATYRQRLAADDSRRMEADTLVESLRDDSR